MHCGVAHAHVRSESFSRWQIDEQTISVTFTVSAREATRIPAAPNLSSLSTTVARYLADRIIIHTQSDGCQSSRTFTPSRSRPGYIRVEAEWRCNTKPESLEIRAFFDLAPEHVHFVTLRTAGHLEQRMLTERNPIWQLRPGESTQPVTADSSTGFWSYVRLGITHISTGYDHIAFLLALLLICRRSRDIVLAVSGFTIGHSITLALGVLGMLRPNTLAIEATIGLTIALVAMEHASLNRRSAVVLASLTGSLLLVMAALSTRQVGQLSTQIFTGLAVFSFCYLLLSHDLQGRGSLRVLMTVLFGLIHGVGFAGAFIDNELPSELLAPLLFGFNVGVEIGQLAVIALILLVFLLLRRRYSARTFVRLDEVFAAGLCGLGIFLLVHRSYGPVTIG
jgi:hypothetical protein